MLRLVILLAVCLFAHGANPRIPVKENATALRKLLKVQLIPAIENQLLSSVERVLSMLPSIKGIHGVTFPKDTPLIAAARVSNVEIVRLLLQKPGCDVNAVNSDGNTALHFAASQANNRIYQMLLSAGARMDIPNSGGQTVFRMRTPIRPRAMVPKLKSIKELGTDTMNPNHLLLFSLIESGNLMDTLKLLRRYPDQFTNIDEIRNLRGHTPLMVAVQSQLHGIVKVLLAQPNVDTETTALDGSTLLMAAASNRDLNMIQLLVAAGADIQSAQDEIRAQGPDFGLEVEKALTAVDKFPEIPYSYSDDEHGKG